MEVSGRQRNAPAALLSKDYSGTHWTSGWVGPRVSLDVSEKKKSVCLSEVKVPNTVQYPETARSNGIISHHSPN
jgi:hypothetical protein